ncbi:hypothetical protein JCM10207_008584, partial [Rhodosporidiobolus poonsookiae]
IIDGEAHWVVDRIVDERRVKPKRGSGKSWQEYLVKWEGRPDEYSRWIREEDLYNAKEALRDYRASRRKQRAEQEEKELPAEKTFSNEAPSSTPPSRMHTRSRSRP